MGAEEKLSPLELWATLQERAGLELTTAGGKNGRDSDLQAGVISELVSSCGIVDDGRSLLKHLEDDQNSIRHRISTEKLLEAILSSQKSFAIMMSDILEVLISAEAPNAEKVLSIEFKFDELGDSDIRETLEQFGEHVQKTLHVLERRWELPNGKILWLLYHALPRGNFNTLSNCQDFPENQFPKLSGNSCLDPLISQVLALVEDFRQWCRDAEASRDTIYQKVNSQPYNDDRESLLAKSLASAASDHWDTAIERAVEILCEQLRYQEADEVKVAEDLREVLKDIESRDAWVERSFHELLDILNLPIWKKRHELYSVWVGVVLLRSARNHSNSLQFNPTQGVLSFSFAGSKLATYSYEGKSYDVWAELRSDLVGASKKRKTGIQPDFRVVLSDDIYDSTNNTVFALECKHYLKQSTTNFSEAVNDYAESCPKAEILLVNYGPIEPEALKKATRTYLAPRIHFLGSCTPKQEKLSSDLGSTIKKLLFPSPPLVFLSEGQLRLPSRFTARGRIKVSWDTPLEDVDLSLEVYYRGAERPLILDYQFKGDLTSVPFALLSEDVRTAPGSETIDIVGWPYDRYEVIVRDFTGKRCMKPGALRIDIWIGHQQVIINFQDRDAATCSLAWHAATLYPAEGVIEIPEPSINSTVAHAFHH